MNQKIFLIVGILISVLSKGTTQCGGPDICKICPGATATITNVMGGTLSGSNSSTISSIIFGGFPAAGNTPFVINANQCTDISFEVHLSYDWYQGTTLDRNWVHGVSFPNNADFGSSIVPGSTLDSPDWHFLNSITGICNSLSYGAGYYYDPLGTDCGNTGNISNFDGSICTGNQVCEFDTGNGMPTPWLTDGDPSDNWGVNCGTGGTSTGASCPNFSFILTYCPLDNPNYSGTISFLLSGDGDTGGWLNSGCTFQLDFPIQIITPEVVIQPSPPGPVCLGDCVTLDADVGLSSCNYSWNTGASTSSIQICPSSLGTSTYTVTVGSAGCEQMATIDVETVFCCTAEAGAVNANPMTACPNEIISLSVISYETDPLYTQKILVVNDIDEIIDIINGDTGLFSSASCDSYTIYSYNYYTAGGSTVPSLGMDISMLDCSVECCDLEMIAITTEDTQDPVFTAPPSDMNLNCNDELSSMQDLDWTDNCSGAGIVSGSEVGSSDFCNGGNITRTWTYTDNCGNTATHTQNISIAAFTPPSFVNPPGDMNIPCDAIPASPPDLDYTNGESGVCEYFGTVPGVQTGSGDICGGTITYTWTIPNPCGADITHTQNLSITPANPPAFINPPGDMNVSCDNIPTSPPTLDYTNGESGTCEVSGTVTAQVSGSGDICGGSISYTWTAPNPCGADITHTQTITVTPAANIYFINPPADMNISCDAIPASPPDLDYTNGESGSCLITGTVPGVQSGNGDICGGTITYSWSIPDPCGGTLSHTQNLTIIPATPPAFINPPADMNISCDAIPASPPDLDYTNNENGTCEIAGTVPGVQSGNGDICGGTITYTWTAPNPCGADITHTQNLTITPAAPPAFINPPADMNISCDAIPASPPDLDYTNNENGSCEIAGTVPGVQSGSGDICGGTITYTWTAPNPCGADITHTQNLTITPAAPPAFINPPADMNISCDAIPASPPDLDYTNNENGSCEIAGTVPGVQSGSGDICGGTITYTWTAPNPCGADITHTQNLTITPAAPPAFINPPADMNISCDAIPASPPDLDYTNNENGSCEIAGTVPGVQSGSGDICGGTITYTWTAPNPCGADITHTQNLTITPAAPPAFINPPADMNISCDAIPASPPDLDYTNNENGSCEIAGTVPGVQSGSGDICGGTITYRWTIPNPCGTDIVHTQNLTIIPANPPAFINPPGDMNVSCDNIPSSAPDLDYTNGESGTCEIAGTVSAVESGSGDLCGGTITYTWTAPNPCGTDIVHIQNITITPALEPNFINLPPPSETVDCNSVPSSPPDLFYTNNDPICPIDGSVQPQVVGSYDECGGLITYLWSFTDVCGRTISYSQDIIVNPAPMANFVDPPINTTISCADIPPTPPDLMYTNNDSGVCDISGSVPAVQTINYDACGGTIQNTWEYTDNCGRVINHSQLIIVEPAPEAGFINPPPDMTLDCDDLLNTPLELDYSNGISGTCEISGSVPAIQSGSYDACGGTLQNTWQFIDNCGRQIVHAQIITILPAADPNFVELPPDMTLECNEPFPVNPYLEYDNFLEGNCEIHDSVQASVTVINALTNLYSWTFTNPCTNNTITHSQVLTLNPGPDIQIVDPLVHLCEMDSFDLASLEIIDYTGSDPVITFHSGTPGNASNELQSTIVSPAVNTTYYVLATNDQGCTDEDFLAIEVEPGVDAGEDGFTSLCPEDPPINLFDYLGGNPDFTGGWFDFGNTGINITNPGNVSFNGVDAGTYPFHYIVYSQNSCPNDTAVVSVEVFEEATVNVENVECTDLEFYSVLISGDGLEIIVSDGMIDTIASDTFNIYNIPIDSTLTVNVQDTTTLCIGEIVITPPNCACPNIPVPVSGGDQQICEGEPIPSLTVTVGVDETANWYDSPTGGNLLLASSTSFTPAENAPGVYNYYVEAASIPTPECTSSLRVEVSLEIIALPVANDAELSTCDDDLDGITVFDLSVAIGDIIMDPSMTITFHENLADAESGDNPVGPMYTNVAPGMQIVFVAVQNSFGCQSIAELSLHVLPIPELQLDIADETCIGDNDGSVEITGMGGTGSIMYSLDGIDFQSNAVFTDLAPGDYTAFVVDENNCGNQLDFSISEGFEFEIAILESICNDNNTSSDPSDDFYIISFTLNNNQGNIGEYELSDGSNSYGPFLYGTSNEIALAADGQIVSLAFVNETGECFLLQDVGPLNSCSTSCEISINQLDFLCNDNGTASDPNDDFYEISISVSSVNGSSNNMYEVQINGVTQYSFMYDLLESFTLPANGQTVTINVVDNQDLQCQTSQLIGPLDPCSNQCDNEISLLEYLCEDNGTETDPSDDYYTVSLVAEGTNTASSDSFDLFIDGNYFGSYSYGNNNQFNLPADGSTVDLQVVDQDDSNCMADQSIGPLNSCSTTCSLSLDIFESICDDAGTPLDPSDDEYQVTVTVTAINGSPANQFNVSLDGMALITGNYGESLSFNLAADQSVHILTFQDENDPQCVITQSIGPLNPCSNQCEITASAINISCDDLGTSVNDDDQFYFDITVNGTNTSSGWYIEGTSVSGTYGQTIGLGPYNIVDGDIQLTIIDNDDPNCSTIIDVTAPGFCSPVCEINANAINISCDDLGTSIGDDDQFYFDLTVTGLNNSSGWYIDGTSVSGTYGQTIGLGPYNIVDGDIQLTIIDNDDPNCSTIIDVTAPGFCSPVCEINANAINISCDDLGTSIGDDDQFYFDLTVTSPNNSSGWYIDGTSVSGTYGQTIGLGPYNIVDGDIQLTIIDNDDPNCSTIIDVTAPGFCSPVCEINANAINIGCDDLGTSVGDDDQFYFDLTVTGPNNSSGWYIDGTSVSGTYGQTIGFGPYNIVDGDIQLTIIDNDDPNCSTIIDVTAPGFCSPVCEIFAAAINISCDDLGSPTNSDDDEFYFDLEVTGNNTSSGWYIDGTSITGNYNQSINLGPYLIADGDLQQTIIDNDDPSCTTIINVTAPAACSTPCVLLTELVQTLDCNDNGTGGTEDDDFFSVIINITDPSNTLGQYEVSFESSIWGPFNYNEDVTIDNLPANGQVVNLSIVDLLVSECFNNIQVTQSPCSNCNRTIQAGEDQMIDCATNFVELTVADSEAVQLDWTGPQNFSAQGDTVEAFIPGIYYITATFDDQCTAMDSLEVIADDNAPVVIVGPDQELTCTLTEVTLEGSLSGTSDNVIIQWLDENMNVLSEDFTLHVDHPGSYFFQAKDTLNSCVSALEEVIVTENTNTPLAVIYTDPDSVLNCFLQSINLYTIPEPHVIYTWSFADFVSNETEITVSNPDMVNLVALDTLSGCTNTDQIEITSLQDYPYVELEASPPLDCQNLNVTLDATGSQMGENLIFNWFNESNELIGSTTDGMYNVTMEGTYYLQLIDTTNGCARWDTTLVLNNQDFPIINAGEDIFLNCNEAMTNIFASGLDLDPGVELSWTNQGGEIISIQDDYDLIVEGPGLFIFNAYNPGNGCEAVDSVEVFVSDDAPQTSAFNVKDETCFLSSDGGVTIEEITGGTGPYDIFINGEYVEDPNNINGLEAGMYTLEVVDALGCSSDTTFVIEEGTGIDIELDASIEVVENKAKTIEVIVNIPTDQIESVVWTPSQYLSCDTCLTTEILGVSSQTYTVLVTDVNGCTAEATIRVDVVPLVEIYIPNVFTPNEDGTNDGFTLYSNENVEEIVEFRIYDRWGELVFLTNNIPSNRPELGWDGMFRGEPVELGVYAYYFDVRTIFGERQIYAGDVTVIR